MATSYTNYLGSGERVGLFKFVTDFNIGSRDPNYLVDGNTTSSQFWFDAQAVAGKSLELRPIGSARVIDAFKIYQASHTGTVAFKFQGWDGSTWTDLTSFNWPTASGATEFTFANTTAYQRYRFLGVSGSITNGYIYELEFSSESADAYEIGDRSSSITVTASGIITGGGNVQNLVDGSELRDATHSWYPNSSQAVTPTSIIKFALAAAKTFVAAKIRMSSSGASNNGTWKWQGSNDNSTWTDVSEPFLWDFNGSTAPTSTSQAGFCYFENPASYSYYRLIGIEGLTSNSPWYMEVLFDAGDAPDWPATLNVAAESAGVLTTGTGSSLRISSAHAEVLSQGPGSTLRIASIAAHVLVSLGPAGELKGDTNAGVYNDITEFGGGDGPPDPLVLEATFEDDFQFNPEININVANPFFVKFFDDFQLNVIPAIVLTVTFDDDFQFDAFSQDLTPIPPVQSMLVTTGRKLP